MLGFELPIADVRSDRTANCTQNTALSLTFLFQHVMTTVDNLLSVTATDQYSRVHDKLWATINEEITLPECDIYSYNPDLQSDPFGEDGSLWSFNFFFYNRRLKRIVLFTCRALSPFSSYWADPTLPEQEDYDISEEIED